MDQGCPWLLGVLCLSCVGSVADSVPAVDGAVEQIPLPPVVEVAPPSTTPPAARYALQKRKDENLSNYLSDSEGRALYMLIDDVLALEESACTGTCAREWPPFDLDLAQPGVALDPALAGADLSRFHRKDGPWQLRYLGHPLYMRTSELSSQGAITGDGADGRWFLARDYLAFFGRSTDFDPAGSVALAGTYLTDGAGRTLYICFDDTPATPDAAPSSVCTGDCLAERPPWSPGTALEARIPSTLNPAEFATFERPDGITQLSYRGWPIYYYRGDAVPGQTAGHNQEAWRAIDPIAFDNNEML